MSLELGSPDAAVVLAIARAGSIGGAARALGVAQPSVSARLQTLERRLGTPLFDRRTTGAVPTAAGSRFLPYAERILGLTAAAAAAVVADAGADTPRLRLGVHAAYAGAVIPTIAAVTEAAYVGFDVVDAHTPELVRLVDERSVDLAVVVPNPAPAAVRLTPLVDDPVVCVVAPGHDLARRRVSVVELADHRLAVAAWGQPQHELRSLLVRAGARASAMRDVATTYTAVTLARAAGDLAIVPLSTVKAELNRKTLARVHVTDMPHWTNPVLAAHLHSHDALVATAVRALRRDMASPRRRTKS